MRFVCCLVVTAGIAGCGRGTDAERYVPPEPVAREALDAALAAWKDGQGPGVLPEHSPKVHVVDSMRRAGQRLVAYENLGEVASDGRRGFLVGLNLENPSETRKVRFCVIGIDPLWVFREEELDMISHWSCGASDDAAAEKAKTAGTVNAEKTNTEKTKPQKAAAAANEETRR
jgi:hypothetical protein